MEEFARTEAAQQKARKEAERDRLEPGWKEREQAELQRQRNKANVENEARWKRDAELARIAEDEKRTKELIGTIFAIAYVIGGLTWIFFLFKTGFMKLTGRDVALGILFLPLLIVLMIPAAAFLLIAFLSGHFP